MKKLSKKRVQFNLIVMLVLILLLAACESKNTGAGQGEKKSSTVSMQTEAEGKQPAEPAEETSPSAEADEKDSDASDPARDVSQEADEQKEAVTEPAALSGDSYAIAEAEDQDQSDGVDSGSKVAEAKDQNQSDGVDSGSKAAEAAAPPVQKAQKPEISKQPSEAVIKQGGTAVFEVSARGDGLKYCWQFRKPGDEKWSNAKIGEGFETPVLKIPDVKSGRNRFRYRCRISDQYGETIYTDSVYLYVLGIKASPQNQNVKENKTAAFRISAVGKDLKYKWEYRRSSEEEWKKSTEEGSDTAVLKVTNTPARHNGYRYRCKISDAAGNKIYSKPAVLYVLGITRNPSAQFVKQGETAVFRVKASGKGLKYRWQTKIPGEEEWKSCGGEGVDTPVLKISGVSTKRNKLPYRCKVSDSDGKVTYSKPARLYVLSIQKNPSAQNIRAKQTASFTVSATGGEVRYQWQVRENANSSWRNSSSAGHAGKNLQVYGRTAYNGYQFRCKVSDKKGNTVYSKTVPLYVFGIRSGPRNQNLKSGGTAVFRASASGAGIKYHWQVKDKSGNWRGSGSSGHSTSTLRVAARMAYNGFAFRCKITDKKGRSAYTNSARLYVFGIKSQPSDVLKYSGQTAVFRVKASGSGLKYKWQVKEYTNGKWRNSTSSGHSSNTLKVRAALIRDGFQFRCRVSDNAGHSAYTRTAYLWVDP